MIDQAQAAGIKVLLLTSTMIGEDPDKETNKQLIPYNNFLRAPRPLRSRNLPGWPARPCPTRSG